jgi:hypothetical protein
MPQMGRDHVQAAQSDAGRTAHRDPVGAVVPLHKGADRPDVARAAHAVVAGTAPGTMTTSWRTLATVPPLGLVILVQVAAAWAGATEGTMASVNRIMDSRRRVRAGPEREVMMPPPLFGGYPGYEACERQSRGAGWPKSWARLNRPSRFALEGPDL